MPEWSKGSDSSSDRREVCVGSNPTVGTNNKIPIILLFKQYINY